MSKSATHRRWAFLAGTLSALTAPGIARADGDKVNVGILPGDADAVAYIAQELGLFKNAGLDVALSIQTNGPATAAALVGGTLDIGGVNVGSLASARLRGVPLRMLAPAALVPNSPGGDGDAIMVRKDSTIRTGADLNGKVVGSNALRTLQHASALAWIDGHGGDSKSIKIVEVPAPAMGAALDASRIDAAINAEPWTTQALTTNRSLGPLYDPLRRPVVVFGLCATDQWLQSNPTTAAKFVAAIRQAALWANARENAKERRRMIGALIKQLDQATVDKMILFSMPTALTAGMIQPAVDVMTKYGFLDRPLDANNIIWKP